MDPNNNPVNKYRRQSLDKSLDHNETENSLEDKQELSNSFKMYLFVLTASIYMIYVSYLCSLLESL